MSVGATFDETGSAVLDRSTALAWSMVLAERLRQSVADTSTVSTPPRSEEHTSELQSRLHLVCRLLLEKKKHHDPNQRSRRPRVQVHQPPAGRDHTSASDIPQLARHAAHMRHHRLPPAFARSSRLDPAD